MSSSGFDPDFFSEFAGSPNSLGSTHEVFGKIAASRRLQGAGGIPETLINVDWALMVVGVVGHGLSCTLKESNRIASGVLNCQVL